VRVAECGNAVELHSDLLVVRLEQNGGRVSVRDPRTGQVLLDDGLDGGPRWVDRPSTARWQHRMPVGEHHFGFDERTGPLDKRGRLYHFWCTDRFEGQGPGTDDMYVAIPFSLGMDDAGRAHGRLLNNTHRSALDLTDDLGERMVLAVDSGELDQYVFAAHDPAHVPHRADRQAAAGLFPAGYPVDPETERRTLSAAVGNVDDYVGSPMLSALLGVCGATGGAGPGARAVRARLRRVRAAAALCRHPVQPLRLPGPATRRAVHRQSRRLPDRLPVRAHRDDTARGRARRLVPPTGDDAAGLGRGARRRAVGPRPPCDADGGPW
jgi:hypothetical protein